jgi:SP family general alpha glucoside:H+ symporter-like MFS transporter
MTTDLREKDKEDPVDVYTVSTKQEIAEDVREATELEHKLTFFQAVKLYPKAIGWSMYFSLGVIMLGEINCLSYGCVA